MMYLLGSNAGIVVLFRVNVEEAAADTELLNQDGGFGVNVTASWTRHPYPSFWQGHGFIGHRRPLSWRRSRQSHTWPRPFASRLIRPRAWHPPPRRAGRYSAWKLMLSWSSLSCCRGHSSVLSSSTTSSSDQS